MTYMIGVYKGNSQRKCPQSFLNIDSSPTDSHASSNTSTSKSDRLVAAVPALTELHPRPIVVASRLDQQPSAISSNLHYMPSEFDFIINDDNMMVSEVQDIEFCKCNGCCWMVTMLTSVARNKLAYHPTQQYHLPEHLIIPMCPLL
eukprot:4447013-Amphidinium_carterae.1